MLAANLPGQMSWDSVHALYQVRHPSPLLYDPPVMNFLLGFWDNIIPGPALFVCANGVLFYGSLLALLAIRNRVSWWAVPVALLVAVSPVILTMQGVVWHDVLFADLAIAGFTCLALAASRWDEPLWRNAGLAGTIVLLSAATLSRQNGIVCWLIACVAIFFIAGRAEQRDARRFGLTFAGCALVFLVGLNFFLTWRIGASSYGSGITIVQDFDIAG